MQDPFAERAEGEGRRLRAPRAAFSVLCTALFGCAAVFPPSVDMTAPKLEQGSIAFFTFRIDIQRLPSLEPPPAWVVEVDTVPHHFWSRRLFRIGPPHESLNLSSDYLVAFQLPAGEYLLEGVACRDIGILTQEAMSLPFKVPVHLASNQIVYLGHLTAALGVRQGPIPDNSVLQTLLGRFPYALFAEDRFDTDLALAQANYGLPASITVVNQTIQPEIQP
jgi:hypothetical protein